MRIDPKQLVINSVVAAAMSVLIAGCGNPRDNQPAPSASTTVGTEIDDTVVTTKVKSALFGDPDIKSLDLKVETRKGVVQLSGLVDNQAQIDRAIAATRDVAGVRSVDNNIGLKRGSATVGSVIDDSMITTRVKTALLADPYVKGSDIGVVTSKGKVQLSGFVDSQAQIDQAIAIANKVDGVTRVGNEMSIKK